ncbi:MAG: VPLPA-CTERM sorting domain-containing protein [Gammaproteobacteria bacterium]
MNKIIKSVMLALAMFASFAANAIPVPKLTPDLIDFLISSTNGGSLVWDTSSDRLVGGGINIFTVGSQTFDGTPVVGPVPCPGCVLSFVSGTHTAGGDFSGDLSGSTIAISAGGTPLMLGSFTDGAVLSTKKGLFNILGAGFVDVKNPDFAALMGFSPGITSWTGALNLQFASTTGFKKGAHLSPLSGDVTNTPATPPSEVPVPAAAWLFGSGLIGLVGIARRKSASDFSVAV